MAVLQPILDAPIEEVNGNIKTVTTFSINEDGKKVKNVRTYRIEKKMVSKSIAKRKSLSKFGSSFNDPDGPNPATTVVEDVVMTFVANKDEGEKLADETGSNMDLLRDKKGGGVVVCRICDEDHWTKQCPYQQILGPMKENMMNSTSEANNSQNEESKRVGGGSGPTSGKYVPPSRRGGDDDNRVSTNSARDRLANDPSDRRRDDSYAVRISNLFEGITEDDLSELVKVIAPHYRMYIAKDKVTGSCKGFAFVNFNNREDAEAVIRVLNGYGYQNLILNVEWAKPAAN